MRKISIVKIINFILTLYVAVMPAYSTEVLSDNKEQEPLGSIFSGNTQVNGSEVFFSMEKIDSEQDIANWQKFTAICLTVEGFYNLLKDSFLAKTELAFDKEIQKLTGFSEPVFETYKVKFNELMSNKPSSLRVATNIEKGARAFFSEVDRRGRYVVYASKKPILGKFPFPEGFSAPNDWELNHKDVNLNYLYQHFGDLIMVVCSWGHNTDSNSYENRGIFKSPIISFEDDEKKFSGLSLKLHGFSASVVKKLFPHKEYMYVRAARSMAMILMKSDWKKGEFEFKRQATDPYIDVTSCEQPIEVSYGDTPCLLSINALIRKF